MGKIRLDKYLADMGLGTRTEVKKDIKKGRISVNGEIIKSPEYKIDIFPVGRLDKDTEGLLLITNDGELAHNLLAPKKHVDKKYFVRLKTALSEDNRKQLEEGVDIGEDKLTMPSQVFLLNKEKDEAEIIIREGKFHQIKRMFHAVGNEVIFLKRLSMGSLVLDENLLPGEYRLLTPEEIERLKENA